MNFDSYIVSNTKTSLSMPLACPPKKLKRSKNFKCFAFTLAETLITLTIIGVIAALTIPTLLNKYTKHTYVVGLKKAYSQLQHAMKMIPITEGCSAGDYDCAGVFQDWGKVTNIDGQDFGGNPNKKRTYLLSKQFKTQDVNAKCPFQDYFYCFSTNDGMTFSPYNGYDVYVDINGIKGPNKVGRDQFGFHLANKDENGIKQGTVIPNGSKLDATYSGSNDKYWKNNNMCTTERVNAFGFNWASYCTGRVLEEDAMNY